MTQQRRNPSKPAAQMRKDAAAQERSAQLLKAVAAWEDYRESTPIAAETFLPVELVQALDALADEARGAKDGEGQ
jgi:hypothetical protein